jgi:hypothetical protein
MMISYYHTHTHTSMTSVDTIKVRKAGLDKFYTKPGTVEKCLKILEDSYEWDEWDEVIEPSAGNGRFLEKIPHTHKIGLDIMPEHPDVIKQDFFEYAHPGHINKRILCIGNPPFGRSCSMAVRFFNHAAQFADVIAFIIPRTFRRISIHNQLNLSFKLVKDIEIPTKPCCFEPPMMVKCCFQIWERSSELRKKIILSTIHPDWDFLKWGPNDDSNQPTPPQGADFAIKAYGGKVGEICETNLQDLRPKSWHWIKCSDIIEKETLIDRFSSLDYSLSLDSARQNSLGKGELVLLYTNRTR